MVNPSQEPASLGVAKRGRFGLFRVYPGPSRSRGPHPRDKGAWLPVSSPHIVCFAGRLFAAVDDTNIEAALILCKFFIKNL